MLPCVAESPAFIVVGAGIAGLATAVALQRRGHSVGVVEERLDTSSGAGISIWPNALAALDELNLGDAVRDAGGGVSAGAMRWRDGTWLRRPSARRIVDALGEPLVVVRRAVLRDILAGALAAGTVRYGVRVNRLATGDGSVRVDMSDGSSSVARAVIGADGTHSVVARYINGPLRSRYAGYTAWRGVADFALDGKLAGETLGPGSEVGHVPLGGDHTYWFATERLPEGQRFPGGELAYLRSKFGGWAEPIPAILAATPLENVLRNDLYDRDPAQQWTRGPVALVGDAAHPMRPHLGQGGCQALEDAAIVAGFLDAVPDPAIAFARFESFRRPRVKALTGESAMIGRIINMRPAAVGAFASRASTLLPEILLSRHLAAIAARSAFAMPPGRPT